MKLNTLHWLSIIAIFSVISGTLVHLFITSDAIPLAQDYTTNTQRESIEPITHNDSQQQVIALTLKLAELQSQVLRLNALGDRLASDNNIPDEEFNFEHQPPSGGPLQIMDESANKSLDELLADISLLASQLQHEEKQLKLLESLTLGHHIVNNSYLSGRPVTSGWLSSYYGVRKDPFNGKAAMHKGVDFAGKEDTAIIATASGVVSWAGERYGYGQLIEINHGEGLKTRFGHNKEILVKVGDVVSKGQVIAKMGSTGRSTGPHVHYEILQNNRQIDPIKYVYRKAK